MPSVHLLGTGGAVTDRHRTTTMLAFTHESRTFLVDCGGDVVQRAQAAGIDLDGIYAVIITHTHPDHIGGFPLLLEKLWLRGRRDPIPVYGLQEVIDLARQLCQVFCMESWKDFPTIIWNVIPPEENATVFSDDTFVVTAAPGSHSVNVIGIRVESQDSGGVVAYSCDTEPCPSIANLARNATILFHEANGAGKGHSSAEQAATIAAEANANELILVHLSEGQQEANMEETFRIFRRTRIGIELGEYAF